VGERSKERGERARCRGRDLERDEGRGKRRGKVLACFRHTGTGHMGNMDGTHGRWKAGRGNSNVSIVLRVVGKVPDVLGHF
jgi:hypothetical protein